MHIQALLTHLSSLEATNAVWQERLILLLSGAVDALGLDIEITVSDMQLSGFGFREVVEGQSKGPATISLADAQVIDSTFEVGESVGLPLDTHGWALLLEHMKQRQEPWSKTLAQELNWWLITLPGLNAPDLSLGQCLDWLRLPQPSVGGFNGLLKDACQSDRAASSTEDDGMVWATRNLWIMDQAWRARVTKDFSSHQEDAHPQSAYAKWRPGMVPVFRSGSGADLGSLWCLDQRAGSPTHGHLINLYLEEPGSHGLLTHPGKIFGCLQTLEQEGLLAPGGRYNRDKNAAVLREDYLLWTEIPLATPES